MRAAKVIANFLIFFALLMQQSCDVSKNTEQEKKGVTEEVFVEELRTITFRYKITNNTDRIVFNEYIKIPILAQQFSRHSIKRIDANIKGHINSDKAERLTYDIAFERMLPNETKVVTISILYSFQNNEVYNHDIALIDYLEETELMPYKGQSFSKVLSLLKAETQAETISKTYRWVVQNMTYSGYIPQTYGAGYALKYRRGDCTEYMYLLAALLRGNGIPTRLVSGYVYSQNSIVSASDYHSWVEVGITEQWQVVDAQKQHIGGDDSMYIPISYLDGKSSEKRYESSHNLTVAMF
ncbi:transglutaminase-like domain-containing protein [Shewanella sedimentimangrovi]|uniref:Transglutaminase domain-containing protein n=1 Tax=Shewanella sedimentimangrovi TaxID=2814293 RepID=A0ABX7R1I3_9GAMM|nr:transglutaminase-like domain-containing protein [Shewanella sedimentimangrovi]QSX37554.1 transglutaminase domain-containing protein [Shewanella sedimentimangrovi]